MDIQSFSLNKIGGRTNLEDAINPITYTAASLPVFVLCDGVGGNSHGEIASSLAAKHFYNELANNYGQVQSTFKTLLQSALIKFQQELKLFISQHPNAENASTTVTVFVISDGKAYLAWCGDSRIYHLRNGNVLYKTKDHSLVAQLVISGEITETEAAYHHQKNIITRCLNKDTDGADIEISVISDIDSGDWFLSCTDGLLEQFTEDKFSIITDTAPPTKNFSKLIDEICNGKTRDNYSMQLVHIGYMSNRKSGSSKKGWLILIAILVAGGLGVYKYFSSANRPSAPTNIIKINQPIKVDTNKNSTTIPDKKNDAVLPIIQKEKKSSPFKKKNRQKLIYTFRFRI